MRAFLIVLIGIAVGKLAAIPFLVDLSWAWLIIIAAVFAVPTIYFHGLLLLVVLVMISTSSDNKRK